MSALNDDRRHAVLYGAGGPAAPLLIIAGAGSGKTCTLAHRLANLVAEGVDSSRILMLTFSRRAAEEMKRRVELILAKHLKGLSTARLEWAGTFHAIGARLLREYAYRIGVDPDFSILDREDAADLMNLVRHELGLSAKESRFPTKAIPQRFYVHQQVGGGDRHVYGSRTRFIPSAILDTFEETSWAPARASATNTAVVGPRIDLSARKKEMWR